MLTNADKVLITGGNGYVARRLARHWLEHTDAQVVLWLHADCGSEFARKVAGLEDDFHIFGNRVQYRAGTLVASHPFIEVEPETITHVVHAAAVTRFNVEADIAQQVNVEGTRKLLDFCRQCPRLEHFTLLSTVYSSGLRPGDIEETPFDAASGFANNYESSKWAAEQLLISRYLDVPWQIFRIATVIADDDGGAVTQYNAFHNTLKLLYYGLLPIVPGKAETPLYFVTGEFVTAAIFELLVSGELNSIYHVAHTEEESLCLGELLDITFKTFDRDAGFSRRRVLRPLYADEQSFARLADSIQGLSGEVIRQAVGSVRPFAKQLFFRKRICNARLVSRWPGYRAPDPRQLVARICDHLVETRWGREAATTARAQPVHAMR